MGARAIPGHAALLLGVAKKRGDALLWAAAPDLLAALKALAKANPCRKGCAPGDMTCATNVAWAAIEKAEAT